jgi:hypothetical protein
MVIGLIFREKILKSYAHNKKMEVHPHLRHPLQPVTLIKIILHFMWV